MVPGEGPSPEDGDRRILRLDAAHSGPTIVPFQLGRNRLALPEGTDDDRQRIAAQPRDVILDNEAYMETGGQPTATAGRTDLAAVATACGLTTAVTIRDESELDALIDLVRQSEGPALAVVKIAKERLPMAFPYSFDGVTTINRFREFASEKTG